MAVAGGGGLCSKRRREDREERATRGEGAARETPGEKQRQSSEQRAGQDTVERAVYAAVLWMRAERRCQVPGARQIQGAGQGSRSESSQVPTR